MARTDGAASIGAMILAAGRGERMQPLTDVMPKPLLQVAGKALIVRQIERLRDAGITEIVVNAAHLAPLLVEALGDGAAFGVRLRWSIEPEPLETAGGIATAYPLLPPGMVLIVSGDICTDYDYARLVAHGEHMALDPHGPRVHLVMVPNPAYHPLGDFVLAGGRVRKTGGPRSTFGNIGLYDTALFSELPRGAKLKLLPLFEAWIARGLVTGELHTGQWANVGTPEELAHLDAQLRAHAEGPVVPAATL